MSDEPASKVEQPPEVASEPVVDAPGSPAAAPTRDTSGATIAAVVGIVLVVGIVIAIGLLESGHGVDVALSKESTERGGDVSIGVAEAPASLAPRRAPATPPRASATDADSPGCGIPAFATEAASAIANDPRPKARVLAAERALADALAAKGDQRQRVVGLMFRGAADAQAAVDTSNVASTALCGSDQDCIDRADKQAFAAFVESHTPPSEAIASIAVATHDPFIYGSAISVCNRYAEPQVPSCALLSVEQWARLDPDNAFVWLHLASVADQRHDTEELNDAMFHVAHSTSSHFYGDQIVAMVDSAVSPGMDEAVVAEAHLVAAGMVAAIAMPGYLTVTRYCSEAQLVDSNRWQTCDAVAHGLIDHPATLFDRRIGALIGARLGWAPETIAALRRDNAALMSAQMLAVVDASGSDSCHDLARWRAYASQVALLGEVGASRAVLQASGLSDEAAASEARRRTDAQLKRTTDNAAVGAASTASAP